MDRSRWAFAGTAVAGSAMVVAALSGVGQAAVSAPSASAPYALTRAFDYYTGHNIVVRWAPCITTSRGTRTHVIDYKVNPAGHATRVKLAQTAVSKISAASGLTFKYAGRTRYIPHSRVRGGQTVFQALDQEQQTGVPLVIAWAKRGTGPGASNLLTSFEAGVGTISWRSSPKNALKPSQLRINDAAVVIKNDAASTLKAGFVGDGSIGALLLHELGHGVGLQHSRLGEIMYPIIGPGTPANYAAGDRTGLAKVGRPAGCMSTPRLRAVNHF